MYKRENIPLLFQQCTILKEDLAGFVFESNRGTKHTFTAETSLGPEFSSGWSSDKTKTKFRSKIAAAKLKVRNHAREVYEKYFKAAQATPRGVVAKLCNIVSQLESACDKHSHHIQVVSSNGEHSDWRQDMKSAFSELLQLLKDEHAISAYELHSSGLVQALFNCLNVSETNTYAFPFPAKGVKISLSIHVKEPC